MGYTVLPLFADLDVTILSNIKTFGILRLLNYNTPKHPSPCLRAILLALAAHKLDRLPIPVSHQVKAQPSRKAQCYTRIKLNKPITEIGCYDILKPNFIRERE